MRNGRGIRPWVGATVLLVVLLATGVAAAAGHPTAVDPSFGDDGVVLTSLPASSAPSRFELIVPAANGGMLLDRVAEPKNAGWENTIERREADGALDPTFGDDGSVKVRGVEALAEDPAGGVVYIGYDGLDRLEPDGSPDPAFDAGAEGGGGESPAIAFDAQGRILLADRNLEGPRAHPHEGETEVSRYEADGRLDRSFGSKGVVYLGQSGADPEIAVLPDGSLLVDSGTVFHLAADGTVLSKVEPATPGGRPSLAVFPDGSFAVAGSAYEKPGCTVTRYGPDGSLDKGFAQAGLFTDPQLSRCAMAAAPEGGLLIAGATGAETPSLILLTAAGAPATGFGEGGSITVPAPADAAGAAPLKIEGLLVGSGGRIVVAGGTDDAVLVGLGPNGGTEPSIGASGSIVQPASPASQIRPHSIVAEPDGELIVTGLTNSGSVEPHPFWMRFDADGNLIPTASGEPYASVPMVGTDLTPAGSGYLYALVDEEKAGTYVAKFETDGALVGGFGDDGLARLPHGLGSTSLVVDPDGGVTAVGHFGDARTAAYRLSAVGLPEAGFGRRGLATVRFPGAGGTRAASGATAPGGGIVIGRLVEEHLALAELGPDGHLRRDFGHGGFTACRCVGILPNEIDLAVDRGNIYALDHWAGGSTGEGTSLVKVSAAGKIDRSFGGRGHRTVYVGSPIALFASGGKLIVVGQKAAARGPAQVREFRLDGTAERSIDAGTNLVPGSNELGFDHRLGVTVQPGGRIVFAGERRGKSDFEGSRLELLGLR